jgi:D-beta-D-heptose 7-phosphate kinase/D-beta-D-heptose 1-phosphate adenosyltransferase
MGELLLHEPLTQVVADRQRAGECAVFTNGVFDLLHLGHITYLRRARALGDFLILGLNSDESTRRLKGPLRPLVPEAERAEVLAALTCVDYVTIFGDNTAESLVRALRPAIYVKGGDYAGGAGSAVDFVLSPDELSRILAGDASAYPTLAGLAERLPEARTAGEYGSGLVLLSYLPGHSTSDLIERIVSRYTNAARPPGKSNG